MQYTWTIEKNRSNLQKHSIAFEDAKRIFEGLTVERVDNRFDYGEIRVYAIGLVNGVEITVIYSDRDDDETGQPQPNRNRGWHVTQQHPMSYSVGS